MSTQLAPVLFASVGQTADLAVAIGNNWTGLANVLIEDANYARTDSIVTTLRYSYTMQLSQPNFPAYPAGEVPTWFRLSMELEALYSNINNIFIRLADGTRRQFTGVSPISGINTRYYSGYLSDWGITQQQANDIMAGTEPVQVYCSYDEGDEQLRVYWAKLEALVQEPQTEVLSPPAVF